MDYKNESLYVHQSRLKVVQVYGCKETEQEFRNKVAIMGLKLVLLD